jgi:hypothetical protein
VFHVFGFAFCFVVVPIVSWVHVEIDIRKAFQKRGHMKSPVHDPRVQTTFKNQIYTSQGTVIVLQGL